MSRQVSMQEKVAEWEKRNNFGGQPPEWAALGLCEEAGELARASLKRAQGIRGTSEEWLRELRKEAGDVGLRLYHVAVVYGFDLEQAIRDRYNEISTRDFVANPLGHGLPEQ